MQKQLNNNISKFLSPFLWGYRKGYSAQFALMSLIEKWQICLDQKRKAGAVLMDLSKAFDTINLEFLIVKLHQYGFSKDALEIIQSFLSVLFQRIKINNTFSSWIELIDGVPQGYVLGPILFNIYLNYLFFLWNDIVICDLADDTAAYAWDVDLEGVLEKYSELVINWFEKHGMKLNSDKYYLIVSGTKYEHVSFKVGKDKIWEN